MELYLQNKIETKATEIGGEIVDDSLDKWRPSKRAKMDNHSNLSSELDHETRNMLVLF